MSASAIVTVAVENPKKQAAANPTVPKNAEPTMIPAAIRHKKDFSSAKRYVAARPPEAMSVIKIKDRNIFSLFIEQQAEMRPIFKFPVKPPSNRAFAKYKLP